MVLEDTALRGHGLKYVICILIGSLELVYLRPFIMPFQASHVYVGALDVFPHDRKARVRKNINF